VVRSAAPAPFVLHGSGATCRVRTWSGDPSVAQMVLYQQRRLPTPDDVHRWLEEISARGFRRLRTGALNSAQAALLTPFGFEPIQRLALLEHPEPRHAPRPSGSTGRLGAAEHDAASAVDRAAFPPTWGLDAAAIADVCRATHRHRARAVHDGGCLTAFAISGRDGTTGFLQRLAVHPSTQGGGIGRRLVLDSLHWAGRWRCTRVLVNTHVDNHPALALYASTGFVRLDDHLVVLEHPLAGRAA